MHSRAASTKDVSGWGCAMIECTARQFLEYSYRLTSVAQTRIMLRAQEYSMSCQMWALHIASKPYAESMDQQRCSDLARMASTLAFLAFPDLREAPEEKVTVA
jgi:hypothetical protein